MVQGGDIYETMNTLTIMVFYIALVKCDVFADVRCAF
jgi:hypothetical protein